VGRLTRVLFLAGLGLAAYYAFFGGRYSVFEVRTAEGDRDVLSAQLDSLEEVNAALAARVDSLETDPATLERVAREEYGMVRPGETIYRREVPDSTDGSGAPRTQ
jgi:cell division protein FtsB